MTPIPARLLRPLAEACKNRPVPTQRDLDRHAHILEAGQQVFIQRGRADLTMAKFASAIGVSQPAIRRQICDLDHLFGLVLLRHLDRITEAVSRIPHDAPNLHAQRRAVYFNATRDGGKGPTPLHLLLVRGRFSLPPDELVKVEARRAILGNMVSAGYPEDVLWLLDCSSFDLGRIEAMMTALHQDETRCPADPPEVCAPRSDPPEPQARSLPARPSPLQAPRTARHGHTQISILQDHNPTEDDIIN